MYTTKNVPSEKVAVEIRIFELFTVEKEEILGTIKKTKMPPIYVKHREFDSKHLIEKAYKFTTKAIIILIRIRIRSFSSELFSLTLHKLLSSPF